MSHFDSCMNEGNLLNPLMRTHVSCNLQIFLGAGHARSLTLDIPTQITTNGPALPDTVTIIYPHSSSVKRQIDRERLGIQARKKNRIAYFHISFHDLNHCYILLRMDMTFIAQTLIK